MTQEEKQLLLKDICGRLPYGVKGFVDGLCTVSLRGFANYVADDVAVEHDGGNLSWIEINNFKPYLRSMSSMTDEECKEVGKHITIYDTVDWMNKHHFDYHGLIEKGLALESPEGMYKTE